jgi:hypothetical protein
VAKYLWQEVAEARFKKCISMIVRFAFDNASEAVILSDELGLPWIKDIAFELVMGENYVLQENESYWSLRNPDSYYVGVEDMIGLQPLEVVLLLGETLSGVYLESASRGCRFSALHGSMGDLEGMSQIG